MCTQTSDKYKRIELSLEAKHFITRLESQVKELEAQRDEAQKRIALLEEHQCPICHWTSESSLSPCPYHGGCRDGFPGTERLALTMALERIKELEGK